MKMKITIRTIYQGNMAKIMQGASFPVNEKRFKEDPDQELLEWHTNG